MGERERKREREGSVLLVGEIKSDWPTGTGVEYPNKAESEGESEHGRSHSHHTSE